MSPVQNRNSLDKRTTTAVESLLSLRDPGRSPPPSGEEWRPLSPASSVSSGENSQSPPEASQQEVVPDANPKVSSE